MIRGLLEFLQGEYETCLQRCDGPPLDAFAKALFALQHVPSPDDAGVAELTKVPFQHTYRLITSRTAAENDSAKQWACMLVDGALLQALGCSATSDRYDAILPALHGLDHATVIGDPSPLHLSWIWRAVGALESLPGWLQGHKPADKHGRLPSSGTGAKIGPVRLPDVQFPVKRYSANVLGFIGFQDMIADPDASAPFIIEDAISFWPALSSRPWSNPENLRQAVGHHRLVPVEMGAKYTDDEWLPRMMPFGEFLDDYIYSNSRDNATKAYLAQHNLLSQAPKLGRDFALPDYTLAETGRRVEPARGGANDDGVVVSFWLGPEGTVSSLHHDPQDNLFAQVVGYKHIHLYSPDQSERLYPHPPESLLANTSQVDVESLDLNQYPLAAAARYLDCVIGPGELLYIPPRWWHHVRALSTSASLSFWF